MGKRGYFYSHVDFIHQSMRVFFHMKNPNSDVFPALTPDRWPPKIQEAWFMGGPRLPARSVPMAVPLGKNDKQQVTGHFIYMSMYILYIYMYIYICMYIYMYVYIYIWGFPEMGVPPNHLCINGVFHYKPTSYWDPPFMETPIYIYMIYIYMIYGMWVNEFPHFPNQIIGK